MTPPPTRTAASGSRLSRRSPLPVLSLPAGRPCPCPPLCSASFLPPCVPVSCLRLAVYLGLGLRTPPPRSHPEVPPCTPPPARDRTSCPRGRAFPGLRVTRQRLRRAPLPTPDTPALPTAGPDSHPPTRARPSPLIGTRAEPAHAPAASPRGVSAHARSPLPQRPAGAAGGQPAARLGGGGAACARAQKGRRSGAQLVEEKAARCGAAPGGGFSASAAGGGRCATGWAGA